MISTDCSSYYRIDRGQGIRNIELRKASVSSASFEEKVYYIMAKERGSLDNRLPKKQCLMKGECFYREHMANQAAQRSNRS